MKHLLISYSFPPFLGPEAIQTARLIKYLEDIGVKNYVLTSKAKNNSLTIDFGTPHITRAKSLENKFDKAWRYVINKDLLHMPDTKKSWIPFAYRQGLKILGSEDIDVVHSWSTPISSHVTALKLRKKRRFKWVAHFSDPWTDNPYIELKTQKAKNYNLSLEKEVIEQADRLVFTSIETVDLIMKKYNKELRSKAVVIPHSYDVDKVNLPKVDKVSNFKELYHIGNFYGKRNPESIINAVKMALKKDKTIIDKIKVKLIGRLQQEYLEMLSSELLGGVIEYLGVVPYEEAQKLMSTADVLITIDAPLKNSVFLPSKLVEYIGYNTPILGISPKDSTTTRVLNEAGHSAFENSDIDGISNYLLSISNEDICISHKEEYHMNYHPLTIAKQYKDLFEEIIYDTDKTEVME